METAGKLNVPEGYTAVRHARSRDLVEKLIEVGVEGLRDDGQPICRACTDHFCHRQPGQCPVDGDWVLFKTELLLKGKLLGLNIKGEI